MSLFVRLFKYRAGEKHSPEENFLTEALAGVLETSRSLSREFAEWLFDKCYSCPVRVESVRIATQKPAESGKMYFDLWLDVEDEDGARHVILFENKISAGEGESQLEKYEKHLRDHYPDAKGRTLIYLTPQNQSDFERSEKKMRSPTVFREKLQWFEVADWMKTWAKDNEAERRGSVLVGEFTALMEEWTLTMTLNASDLATAVAYRTRVRQRMVSILKEVKGACGVEETEKNKWAHLYRGAVFQSPWIGDDDKVFLEFGFDFDREDGDWSVSRLQLPSAYFAVRGNGIEKHTFLPSSWNEPPESWGWKNKAKVKRMDDLEVGGDSLHLAYLRFFKEALKEAEAAAGLA